MAFRGFRQNQHEGSLMATHFAPVCCSYHKHQHPAILQNHAACPKASPVHKLPLEAAIAGLTTGGEVQWPLRIRDMLFPPCSIFRESMKQKVQVQDLDV